MDPQIKALYIGNRRCGLWPGSADKRAFPLHLAQCIIDENGVYTGGMGMTGADFQDPLSLGIQENGDLLELWDLLPALTCSTALGIHSTSQAEISLMCTSHNNVCRRFTTKAAGSLT